MATPPPDPVEAALVRVRAICLAFPAAEEKLSHGAPSFHVRGKMFLNFVEDHHADGRVAVWCKATPDEQRRRVAADPERFFVPPYVGVRGWLGVRLDRANTDWIDLAILVEEGWTSVAPKRLARDGAGPVPRPPPPPPRRRATDARVAKDALERLASICLALPEATREGSAWYATFRVGKKAFVYFLDNHHGEGVVAACVRSDKRANAALMKSAPERFYLPSYIGARGWLGLRLDVGRVDWEQVSERVAASYRSVAPKRLVPG